MDRKHAARLRADATHYSRLRGLPRTLSTYRAALAIAIREGRSNDAADLAFKLAFLSFPRPSRVYQIEFRCYGQEWITLYHDGQPITFDSRVEAEAYADSLSDLHTRVTAKE